MRTQTATLSRSAAVAPAASSPATAVASLDKQYEAEPPNVPFTLTSLREAIPKECFHKDFLTSFYYLVRDFVFLAACYAVYPYINAADGVYNPYGITKFIWWNVVGFFGWCLFVVGHDCGHRTFSDSVMVCDVFGHIAHTPLLVPFHGWRVSHRKHHENHNHVDNDHSWRPVAKQHFLAYLGSSLQARISKMVRFSHALLLIFPIYLLMDSEFTSGNHFNPWSRLFSDKERVGAFISTTCIVAWLSFLLTTFPLLTLLDAYFVPYLFFVAWLDLVTYLQHTDPTTIYYRDSAWSFLMGGLSTIDRSYGKIIDHLHHDIGTHMIHHLFFTKIPHYHLVKATEALKPVLGEHYKLDETPIIQAYIKSKENCHFVADEGLAVKYQPESNINKKEL